ncbi:metallophosphoesterase [Actinoplanes sp. LDG1-06]|uniref:Metallophosphoesterase n=1 Tax=Paractinoplanes ovalisporus TaxID=2810368 RepID=A0ABS2A458_9ACTN|nr:metallophosphoesterase [Actinoplanes ovalisporus]MBM2614059.1 metallophosphoesterase [Actinoplanes ovalisporus]
MRLVDTRPQRLVTVPYRAAGPGGVPQNVLLGVERLRVDRLPAGCDAVLAAGDLQGVAPSPLGGEAGLLGVALADYLGVWADSGLLPPPERVGVLLTGDLYSAPGADRRGASGAVLDVWLAFAAAGCPMVFGVAGNHDEVTAAQVAELGPGVALLDGDRRGFGGLTVAGISGIVGDPARALRRTEKEFLHLAEKLTTPPPDVLLLHEGPDGVGAGQLGRSTMRGMLEARPPALTLCGHVHWEAPVATLGDGHIVNVDSRAVIFGT